MRRSLLALVLLACASPAWATAAFVQSAAGAWSSGTSFSAGAITVAAGNALCIGVFIQSNTTGDRYSSINIGTPVDTQNVNSAGLT